MISFVITIIAAIAVARIINAITPIIVGRNRRSDGSRPAHRDRTGEYYTADICGSGQCNGRGFEHAADGDDVEGFVRFPHLS